MARGLIENAVTAEDIIRACGGKIEKKQKNNISLPKAKPEIIKKANNTGGKKEKKLTKRTLFAMLFMLFSIPLTILFGMYYLGDRKYYIISLLIIFLNPQNQKLLFLMK